MVENLTTARLDITSHAQTQLDELSSRLSKMVSAVPTSTQAGAAFNAHDREEAPSDADSDPAELFHRDYGTQTTPSLSRHSSLSSEASPSQHGVDKNQTGHEADLRKLKLHLSELLADSTVSSGVDQDLTMQMADLKCYLNEMRYQSQPATMGVQRLTNSNHETRQDEALHAVKAEIRSIKGALLSARNFPASAKGTDRSGG